MEQFPFKYDEDVLLSELQGYIESTYGQHYAGKQDIQLFDYWHSLGLMRPVGIATAMKYLARFGKKDGENRKDLLKALHYTLLALWTLDADTKGQVVPAPRDGMVSPLFDAEEAGDEDEDDYYDYEQVEMPEHISAFLEGLLGKKPK